MNKYHKLTEKIQNALANGGSLGDIETDRIIREELGKMAKGIREAYCLRVSGEQIAGRGYVESILGLTDGGEKPTFYICSKHGTTGMGECQGCVSEKPKQEWCEHIYWNVHELAMQAGWFMKPVQTGVDGFLHDGINFCCYCGTPRPKELSLEERVAEAIRKVKHIDVMAMAQAAIDTIKQHEKEN